jgi:hypothetical protein
MGFEDTIIKWLDGLEARAPMYVSVGNIEALESMYLTLLSCLRLHRGLPDGGGHEVFEVYLRITSDPKGEQDCIPIWARDGAKVTQEDALVYLKKVRAEVLGTTIKCFRPDGLCTRDDGECQQIGHCVFEKCEHRVFYGNVCVPCGRNAT